VVAVWLSSASAIVRVAVETVMPRTSSSVMVPFALPPPSAMLTPVPGSSAASAGTLKTAKKVSSGSSMSSSVVATSTVFVSSPLAKLRVCAVVMAV